MESQLSRNGSGVYTVPVTYLSSTTITAAGQNQNDVDLGNEITNSVAADGQTSMTGPLKAANGTNSSPSITFASDANTGIYRVGEDQLGVTIGGVNVATFTATGITNYWSTGDVKLTLKTTADTGWVMMNDGTIGDATSGATTRANADTQALFELLWNNVSDTYAPVTGGRGGSATSDFNAHKKIALTKVLGRALAIGGAGSGLTSRSLGQTTGTETHPLVIGEMPAHDHGGATGTGGVDHTHSEGTFIPTSAGSSAGATNSLGVQGSALTSGASAYLHSHTISSQGSGTAHNNMQPSSFFNAMVKL